MDEKVLRKTTINETLVFSRICVFHFIVVFLKDLMEGKVLRKTTIKWNLSFKICVFHFIVVFLNTLSSIKSLRKNNYKMKNANSGK